MPGTSLRVATLNIAGLPNALRPLRERAPEFCRQFEAAGFDMVNLQEVWSRGQLRIVRSHLPSYPYVAWRRGLVGQPRGGLATFSRLPVADVAYTSFRNARPGGAARFRARLWLNTRLQGVLVCRLPTVGAVVGNTHLSANKDGDWSAGNRHYPLQRAQLATVHTVLRRATRDNELSVVCGDFNVASDGPLYPDIIGDFQDPFATTDPPTFQAELLHPGRRPHRIDYLLVRAGYPIRTSELLFAKPVPDFGLVSDHVGLGAEISLLEPTPPSSPI